jgi:predicted N-acetyltransferase YhbS
MEIVNLPHIPEHLPTVAAWIHKAFWQDSGKSIAFIEGLLADHLAGKPIPTTLVAVEDVAPVGSVCLIESDMAECPDFTPWLAALYVQPIYRKHGIGSQLITRLVDHVANAGVDRVYLSTDDQVTFYARHGFEGVEMSVGLHKLTIMRKTLTKGEQE